MGKLKGKVIFITGSSKGIGKQAAKAFLSSGATVVINGRDERSLIKTAAEMGKDVMPLAGDMSEPETIESAIKSIIERFGKLDVIILNAGLSSYGLVEETSNEALQNVLKVNSMGPFFGARSALPHIRESKGSIVFISSLAGLQGIPRSSVYSMSKMALTALAQALKTELTGTGVHVGIVYVSFTKNGQDKTVVAPDGSIHPIQDRPSWVQQSQESVARQVLNNVKRRRFKSYLSSMGKIIGFLTRYFPRLFQFFMRSMLTTAEKLTRND